MTMKFSKDDFKNKLGGGNQQSEPDSPMSDSGGLLSGYYDISTESNKVSAPMLGTSKKIMEATEKRFLTGINNSNDLDSYFEDPTFLCFHIAIISDNSPLFNYGNGTTPKNTMASGALNFIQKYSSVPEIASREGLYNEFINNVNKIFYTNEDYSGVKNHYINKITGVDKLFNSAKFVDYGKDVLKLSISEDVGLRSTYLSELYNNLTYSYKNGHYLIPENCLRFDMEVTITDYRKFKLPFLQDDGTYKYQINYDCPRLTYRLFDCNFDFFDSRPHAESMTIAGFGASLEANASEVELSIKYKSVERVFGSNLIHNSVKLSNKKAAVTGQNEEIDYTKLNSSKQDSDNARETQINKTKKQPSDVPSIFQGGSSKDPLTDTSNAMLGNKARDLFSSKITLKSIEKSLKNKLKEDIDVLERAGYKIVNEFKTGIQARIEGVKDLLIHTLKEELRSAVGIPRIYPENLYEQDITDKSLTSILNREIVDASNDAEKIIGDLL